MKNKSVLLFLIFSFSFIVSIFPNDTKIQPSDSDQYIKGALSDPLSKAFVVSATRIVYELFGVSSKTVNDIIDILSSDCKGNLKILSKKLNDYIWHTDFGTVYQKYKIGSTSRKLNLFKRFIEGPVIADIGCGSGDLSEEIIKNVPSVRKIIATDVKEYHKKITSPSIEFRLQLQPDKIPIDSNTVDTALLIYVLHHVEYHHQEGLLKEVNRILKKGGKVVILEDTYSDFLSPEREKELMNFFLELDYKQKRNILSLGDWLCNIILKDIDMPLPCTFRSMEDWERCFNGVGLSVAHKQFLGIPQNSVSFAPRSIFVLKKTSDIPVREITNKLNFIAK